VVFFPPAYAVFLTINKVASVGRTVLPFILAFSIWCTILILTNRYIAICKDIASQTMLQ